MGTKQDINKLKNFLAAEETDLIIEKILILKQCQTFERREKRVAEMFSQIDKWMGEWAKKINKKIEDNEKNSWRPDYQERRARITTECEEISRRADWEMKQLQKMQSKLETKRDKLVKKSNLWLARVEKFEMGKDILMGLLNMSNNIKV